jgi:[ribosomal protein S18]-alanine N-acetyltransferase
MEIPKVDNLIIRPIRESDLIDINILENKLFTDPWPPAAFLEVFESDEIYGLVAEMDGKIAAYAVYTIGLGESRLANIAVDDDFRRKSIAKNLLNNILKIVKEANCEYIFLDVRPSNAAAISLYKKFGFTELYTKPNYYRSPREDVLVMMKNLRETD